MKEKRSRARGTGDHRRHRNLPMMDAAEVVVVVVVVVVDAFDFVVGAVFVVVGDGVAAGTAVAAAVVAEKS